AQTVPARARPAARRHGLARAISRRVGAALRRARRGARGSEEARTHEIEAQGEAMSDLNVTIDVPTEIKMTRTFDAPRPLVIQAMTKPELLKRWLGTSFSPVTSVEIDARVGGKYRYAYRTPDGREFAFAGVVRELTDERFVHTEAMEGTPGEAVVTTTFVEQG